MSRDNPSAPKNPHREKAAEEIRQVLARLQLTVEVAADLIQPDGLIDAVLAQWQPSEVPKVGDVAYQLICRKIYAACNSNQEGLRETAYQWLGGYLYRGIWHKLKGDAGMSEDLTNNALELIFKKMESCRQPEFFLSWAAQIATREVLQYLRKQTQLLTPSSAPAQTDDTNATALSDSTALIEAKALTATKETKLPEQKEKADEIHPALQAVRQKLRFASVDASHIIDLPEMADKQANPEALFLSRELLQMIIARIEQFKTTKRASAYKAILYGTYFAALEDSELATRLNLSVQEVQKHRHQALKVLRSDADWLETIR